MLYTRGLIITLFFFVLSNFAWAQEETERHLCLVEENSFSVGMGGVYSFDLETTGINGRFYYNIRENICFGPEFSYIKTDEVEVFDFDVVAHYIFETPWLGIYPVVGINYSAENILHTKSEHESEAGFGVIYGFGIHRNIKRFTIFTEYSRLNGAFKDQFLTLGAIYRFNLKHE